MTLKTTTPRTKKDTLIRSRCWTLGPGFELDSHLKPLFDGILPRRGKLNLKLRLNLKLEVEVEFEFEKMGGPLLNLKKRFY